MKTKSRKRRPVPDRTGQRHLLPFGLHQLSEYLVAAFLAETALHLRGDTQGALLAAAGSMAAASLLSQGTLGLVRVLGPRLHRAIDVMVVLTLALLPAVLSSGRSLTSTLVSEVAAIALARLVWSTRYHSPSAARGTGAAVTVPAHLPSDRSWARQLGRAAGRARAQAPSAQHAVNHSARRLGQMTAQVGRKVEGRRHRP